MLAIKGWLWNKEIESLRSEVKLGINMEDESQGSKIKGHSHIKKGYGTFFTQLSEVHWMNPCCRNSTEARCHHFTLFSRFKFNPPPTSPPFERLLYHLNFLFICWRKCCLEGQSQSHRDRLHRSTWKRLLMRSLDYVGSDTSKQKGRAFKCHKLCTN